MDINERYLHDFSLAFRGCTDNWTPPPDYVERCFELARKAQRKDWSAFAAGVNLHVNETGGLVMHQAGGSIVVTTEKLDEFVDGVLAARAQSRAVNPMPKLTMGSNNAWNEAHDDRPGVVEAKRRNEERMAYSLKQEKKRQDDLMYSALARLQKQARSW